MNSKDLLLVPKPKKITARDGLLKLARSGYIVLQGEQREHLMVGAKKLASAIKGDWKVTASPAGAKTTSPIILECNPSAPQGPEGYKLTISAKDVKITAAAPAGVYYGVCTLMQLLKMHSNELPLVNIEDWPDFPSRGMMLDVSRDKVPTLETLMGMVDLLSEWKINVFQLYTEHTFEYIGHEVVWEKASPVTGEDILKLDAYCKERFVELIPNQNSFGHLARWLQHKEYRDLAELPNSPNSLNPQDPRSVKLVADMYDQLLPHFSSTNFNVGCDETHDLGKGRSKELCEKEGTGRVYLDFLLKLHKLVSERGRKMQFWGDIIKNHPELIPELPKDIIAVEWGYGADYVFTENCKKHAAAGIEFWVCPGTATWNTFVARSTNAIQNPANAAREGFTTGATGFLNTDWGDNGHHQFLPVSYLGYMSGAAASWNTKGIETDKLIEGLSAFAYDDTTGTMGQVAFELADSYNKIEKKVGNSTIPFCLLIPGGRSKSAVEGVRTEEFDAVIGAVKDALGKMKSARMKRPDADLIKKELACNGAMVEIGCRIGKMQLAMQAGANVASEKKSIIAQLKKTIKDYDGLWLARNRPGGLVDSRARLEKRLKMLEEE